MNAKMLLLLGLACSVVLSQSASARPNTDDPQYWFDKLAAEASKRLEGVAVYAERIHGANIPGLDAALAQGNPTACFTCRFYQVLSVVGVDDRNFNISRPMSPEEAMVASGSKGFDDENFIYMSAGLGMAQEELSSYTAQLPGPWKQMATNIFGDIDLDADEVAEDAIHRSWETGSEREAPWLNPFRLFGAGSYMYFEAGEAITRAKEGLDEAPGEAQEEADTRRTFWRYATVMGEVIVDGEEAVQIEMPVDAERAGGSKVSTGTRVEASFEPVTVDIWIQPDTLVILKHRVDGIALADGESREFFIEAEFSDFRHVPDSKMYQPYKRVMRMGGLMDDAQMAQMEEARQQLAELDRRMESMSPEQRKMMESMMGSQLDTIRGLANGGVFEYVETIDEILVNPDLEALLNPYPSGMTVESAPNLVRQIQTNLATLGYEPGNTDGLLDTMTKVAISQFQAEHGLAVTGEPSASLLDVLSAQLSNRGAG
jgi:Putative peptidoglycan binding domain